MPSTRFLVQTTSAGQQCVLVEKITEDHTHTTPIGSLDLLSEDTLASLPPAVDSNTRRELSTYPEPDWEVHDEELETITLVETRTLAASDLPEQCIAHDIQELWGQYTGGNVVLSPRLAYSLHKAFPQSQWGKSLFQQHWTPQAIELVGRDPCLVARDVLCFPLASNTLPPFSCTNLVVFITQECSVIVDPGCNDIGKEKLTRIVNSLPKPVHVFLTHHHHDHVEQLGYVETLLRGTNASVYGHDETLSRVTTDLSPIAFTSRMDITSHLHGIPCPGHTSGHAVLLDERTQTLAAGDHVVGHGSAVLDPETGDMSAYLKSTERLLGLNCNLAIPAHGVPHGQPEKLFQGYIAHRLARESSILSAIHGGATTLDAIVETVYAAVPQAMWPAAKRNIVLHLRKLKQDGVLKPSPLTSSL